jgi:uncharacterized membrane protein
MSGDETVRSAASVRSLDAAFRVPCALDKTGKSGCRRRRRAGFRVPEATPRRDSSERGADSRVASMAAAVFGLIGVIVGGVINGAVSWWLERGRQSSDAQSAGRLVQSELVFFRAAAREIQLHWPTELPQLRHAGNPLWQSNRAVLSRALRDEDWDAVQRAYAGIEAFLSLLVFDHDGNIVEWRVNEARRLASEMSGEIDRAVQVLAPNGAAAERYEPADDPRLAR